MFTILSPNGPKNPRPPSTGTYYMREGSFHGNAPMTGEIEHVAGFQANRQHRVVMVAAVDGVITEGAFDDGGIGLLGMPQPVYANSTHIHQIEINAGQ